jgi:thymidylate kinase
MFKGRSNMKEIDVLPRTVVFEGLDGAGTTTQRDYLVRHLEKCGRSVYSTCEPTDKMIGRLIRDILRKKYSTTPSALALLYAADRDDHLYNSEYGIITQLAKHAAVISDRYFYSSFAYQGLDVDWETIGAINRFPHPEYLIYIDTPVDECISRIEKRGEEKEIFEKAEILKRVSANFEKIFSTLPSNVKFTRIDGTLTREEIFEKVIEAISPLLS